jgi:hypothetical protein
VVGIGEDSSVGVDAVSGLDLTSLHSVCQHIHNPFSLSLSHSAMLYSLNPQHVNQGSAAHGSYCKRKRRRFLMGKELYGPRNLYFVSKLCLYRTYHVLCSFISLSLLFVIKERLFTFFFFFLVVGNLEASFYSF